MDNDQKREKILSKLPSIERKTRTKEEYWADRDRIIAEKYLQGCTKEDILIQTGFPVTIIEKAIKTYGLQKVIEDREKQITKRLLKEKVPVLKEIVNLALENTRTFLEELSDPEIRANRLKTIRDARDLSQIASDLNSLLRLELGQATQNVKHEVELSLDETKKVFDELRKVDKVFEYPVFEAEIVETERVIDWTKTDEKETNS